MVSRMRCVAAGLAVAGLTALPAASAAQSTTGATSSQSYGQSSTENKSPRYHLDQAKRVLDELSRSAGVSGSETSSTTTGSGTTGSGTTGSATTGSQSGSLASGATDTASVVSELRRHFTQLEQAYERSRRETSTSGTSGTAGTTGSGTTGSGTTGSGTTGSGTTGSQSQSSDTSESWMTHYSRLNQVLDRINVPKTSTATGTSGSMSGTGTSGSTSGSGTTGSGTTGSGSASGSMSQSGSSSIDASTMSRLREFRMHIDNFHAAAMAEGSRR